MGERRTSRRLTGPRTHTRNCSLHRTRRSCFLIRTGLATPDDLRPYLSADILLVGLGGRVRVSVVVRTGVPCLLSTAFRLTKRGK